MSNHKFQKKPVVVEAFQMTEERRQDNKDWPEWLNEGWNKSQGTVGSVYPSKYPFSDGSDELKIHTLEGEHKVSFGDWIIQGVAGELYPCKPEIFERLYDAFTLETEEVDLGNGQMATLVSINLKEGDVVVEQLAPVDAETVKEQPPVQEAVDTPTPSDVVVDEKPAATEEAAPKATKKEAK